MSFTNRNLSYIVGNAQFLRELAQMTLLIIIGKQVTVIIDIHNFMGQNHYSKHLMQMIQHVYPLSYLMSWL